MCVCGGSVCGALRLSSGTKRYIYIYMCVYAGTHARSNLHSRAHRDTELHLRSQKLAAAEKSSSSSSSSFSLSLSLTYFISLFLFSLRYFSLALSLFRYIYSAKRRWPDGYSSRMTGTVVVACGVFATRYTGAATMGRRRRCCCCCCRR